jgi:hypothetical protein
MNKYARIVERALTLAKKKAINESRLPYKGKDRMHVTIEEDIREGKTSLGDNPILPQGDEVSFMERIMTERFDEVVERYKRAYDIEEVGGVDCQASMHKNVLEAIKIESSHKNELVEIAINMVREEYDMPEDVVSINAEIVEGGQIDMSEFDNNMTPQIVEMEFDDHSMVEAAGNEVNKRRFINAMTEGAAMKTNHMFEIVSDELAKLNPRLPNIYNKMMSGADYQYMTNPNLQHKAAGGDVQVDMPKGDEDIPCINARATTFPVLVHEIVKGVMEILSAHALPEDKKLAEYAMGKADYGAAELWDMRMGPALWGRFTNMIDGEDMNMKHHIYAEVCSKPTEEFNECMKEIMANTKKGKTIIEGITKKIKRDIVRDEHRSKVSEGGNDDIFTIDDLSAEDLI